MPIVSACLRALKKQNRSFELLCLDNESGDGTVEELQKYTDKIINIPKGTYIPGKVLNLGMRETSGPWVVFLNSDCIPQDEFWLSNLIEGISDEQNTAAVFGRQIPHPGCDHLPAKDTEDTYGDGSRQQYWRHCFSMASSAINRSVWEQQPFDENLRYSEDIDWTWKARARGYVIQYIPKSIVSHSHNYSLRQLYRRHYGEGRAEAAIFNWSQWEASLIRYSLMPYGRQVLSDWKYCVTRGLIGTAMFSPIFRFSQMAGRRKGFRDGLKETHI
jgi:rhamnosyltransferase